MIERNHPLNSIIVFEVEDEIFEKYYSKTGVFAQRETVLYLGEIENMKGHIAVVKRNGKVMWGYHPYNFRPATEDEI